MHSKNKGNIAQSSVVLAPHEQGLNVFAELGDLSRIDLIAELNGCLRKIQVKFDGTDKGYAYVKLQKFGPNGYRYSYSDSDIDWFAVYHQASGKIAWVNIKELRGHTSGVAIRINPCRNSQTKNIRPIDDYGIDGLLRDFTQGTVPSINGEDKVQTTTPKGGSGN